MTHYHPLRHSRPRMKWYIQRSCTATTALVTLSLARTAQDYRDDAAPGASSLALLNLPSAPSQPPAEHHSLWQYLPQERRGINAHLALLHLPAPVPCPRSARCTIYDRAIRESWRRSGALGRARRWWGSHGGAACVAPDISAFLDRACARAPTCASARVRRRPEYRVGRTNRRPRANRTLSPDADANTPTPRREAAPFSHALPSSFPFPFFWLIRNQVDNRPNHNYTPAADGRAPRPAK